MRATTLRGNSREIQLSADDGRFPAKGGPLFENIIAFVVEGRERDNIEGTNYFRADGRAGEAGNGIKVCRVP